MTIEYWEGSLSKEEEKVIRHTNSELYVHFFPRKPGMTYAAIGDLVGDITIWLTSSEVQAFVNAAAIFSAFYGVYKKISNFAKKKKVIKADSEIQMILQNQNIIIQSDIKSRFVEMFGDFIVNTKGWNICKFSDIAIIDGNMTTDFEKYANYPHIGIDSIEKNTGELTGYRTVAEDNVVSGKYLFSPKHIIYSKIRPNLNKVALPNFYGVCSADAYPILPIDDKCNRTFLAYVMRSDYFLDYILQFCTRTNLPKVNRKEVSGFTTPLPPLDLQDQFSDFVAKVEQQKTTVQKSIDKLETLKKSLMQEYFG